MPPGGAVGGADDSGSCPYSLDVAYGIVRVVVAPWVQGVQTGWRDVRQMAQL